MFVIVVINTSDNSLAEVVGLFYTESGANKWASETYINKEVKFSVERVQAP